MRRTPRWVALVGLALSLIGSPAFAQSGQPGWIGISFEVREDRGPSANAGAVFVTEVRRGSPADAAGVRVGDRLLAINEIRGLDEFRSLPERLHLLAGDRVRIRLERDGRRLGLRLRAAERPADLVAEGALNLSVHSDSMVETMFRAMDSLRVRLMQATERAVRTAAPMPTPTSPPSGASREGRESVPFEFFVFRGESHDSLLEAMESLNSQIEDLRRREDDRLRELRRASITGSTLSDPEDAQLANLRDQLEQATRRSEDLWTTMAEAARATAGLEYSLPATGGPSSSGTTRPETFRPLTPYLIGSNRVAGAQVIELRPELARYFEVESGVLVLDVSPGTPAATAGIRPGDVLTHLGQAGVRSVRALRLGVSRAREVLPITLTRQGASVRVLLPLP